MSKQEVIYNIDGDIIYKGSYDSYGECVQSAVRQGISLKNGHFRYGPLSNTMLDGGIFNGADFTGANLTAANLSTTQMCRVKFNHADLYNCCLSETNLRKCDFRSANFGGTIIAHSDISGSCFSGLSALDLDYGSVMHMHECSYILDDRHYILSAPPVTIKGFERPIIINDKETQQLLKHFLAIQSTKSQRMLH